MGKMSKFEEDSWLSFCNTLTLDELERMASFLSSDIRRVGKLYEEIEEEFDYKKKLYECVSIARNRKETHPYE